MSMWSPRSLPHLQSPWPRGGVWGVLLLPCLPGPSQPPPPTGAVGHAPGAGGGDQIAKTEAASIPIWEARRPHTSAFFVPVGSTGAHGPSRQPSVDKASGGALLVPPGPAGLESCAWPVSIYCLQMCRPLGPPGLPPLPPGSVPPSPAGPPRTQPGHLWDQVRTVGALPCASPPLASPLRPGPRMFRSLTLLLLF